MQQAVDPAIGDRVSVRHSPAEAPFQGDLVEVLLPTAARVETRYRIRRAITVVVNGFHRNEYWAIREQLTVVTRAATTTVPPEQLLTDHGLHRVPLASPSSDCEFERFEAQR